MHCSPTSRTPLPPWLALAVSVALGPACIGPNPDYLDEQIGGDSETPTTGTDATLVSTSTTTDEPDPSSDTTSSSGETTADASTDGVSGWCGDGVVDDDEECDDGEANNGDGPCTAQCTVNVCGDGYLGPGESCDDGNTDDGDGCDASCGLESCGNGATEPGEECDDGNAIDDDECTNNCTTPICGDGILQESLDETCDDANADNFDDCTDLCLAPFCGDGYVQEANTEQCDDENEVANDGCTNFCNNPPNAATHGEASSSPKEGGNFNEEIKICDDGDILVGVELEGEPNVPIVGNLMTKVKAFCATVEFDGLPDGWSATTGEPFQQGPGVGVNGSDDFNLFCPPGEAITSFRGRRSNGVFKRLTFDCAPLELSEFPNGFGLATGASVTLPTVGYGNENISFGPHPCPQDSVATGVEIGYDGTGLGSIKLLCNTLSVE